jgi:hypothetical protein
MRCAADPFWKHTQREGGVRKSLWLQMGLYIYTGLWDYDGTDMVFSFTSVQEEWYIHAPRRRISRKCLQGRRYLFRTNGINTLPRRRMSRKCLQGRRYLFMRNGINTLSRRRMCRKRLQSRRYLEAVTLFPLIRESISSYMTWTEYLPNFFIIEGISLSVFIHKIRI